MRHFSFSRHSQFCCHHFMYSTFTRTPIQTLHTHEQVPGMCEEEDRRWLAQTLGPLATGNETDPTLLDAARTAYNAKVWKECGMSKNEIAAAYPWARHFGAGFSDKVGADNIGWHRVRPSSTSPLHSSCLTRLTAYSFAPPPPAPMAFSSLRVNILTTRLC